MTAREVLDRYEDLAAVVARMLALAASRRWAPLPVLDAECSELVARLRAADPRVLSPSQRAQLRALTDRIRRDQEQLNALVGPQFGQLVSTLRGTKAAR